MPFCRLCGTNYSYAKYDLKAGRIPDPSICSNCTGKGKDFKDPGFIEGKKSKRKKDKEDFTEQIEEEFGGMDE